MNTIKNYNMTRVGHKNTDIELTLRRALWVRGHRYRKNYIKLIGKPDIVFVKKKIAVFCDGEFWHGFDWENAKHKFKNNKEYWIAKIERNMERDKMVNAKLKAAGWRVLRFWGNNIKKDTDGCIETIESILKGSKNI